MEDVVILFFTPVCYKCSLGWFNRREPRHRLRAPSSLSIHSKINRHVPRPEHNSQCYYPPVGCVCRQPPDISPGPCRWSTLFSEASIMATALRVDCVSRLVPLPSYHRRLDSWCWDDHKCIGVFARYISLYHILWNFKALYISLSE